MKKILTELCLGLLAVVGLTALIYVFQLLTGNYMILH